MKALKHLPLCALLLTLSCSDYQSEIQSPGNVGGGAGKTTAVTTNPFTPEMLNPNDKPFTEERMLLNIGTNIIAKNVHEFALEAQLLQGRADNYCDDLDRGNDATASEQAFKDQWKTAMLAFHAVDVAPVGPASDNNSRLADGIYSWPLISPCGIDTEVAKAAAGGQFSDATLINAKGLGALEYLLFEPTLVPKCGTGIFNKLTTDWGKKPVAEKKKDRCHYARFITQDVIAKSIELDNDWDVNKGNFSKTLVDGSRYTSVKLAVNALSDSMFSLEKIKDEELSQPLGLSAECKNDNKKCPEMAEHAWSGLAMQAIQVQLTTYRKIFLGSANAADKAYGFDDYLAANKHPEVATQMVASLDDALKRLPALTTPSLQEQIATFDTAVCSTATHATSVNMAAQAPLCAFYIDIRDADLTMQDDLLLVLALAAPAGFQGDND